VDAQIQADDRSATQDSLPNLGAASLLNDEPPAAQPPPPAVDLQAGHVAARWMSLRMLLEERLDPLVAARGFYTQECMVTAPQQAADAICAQFVESLRPVRRALGAWLRPETAAPGAHPLAAVAAGEEVVARAREVVREVLEHRVGVWRYRRLEEFNLRERCGCWLAIEKKKKNSIFFFAGAARRCITPPLTLACCPTPPADAGWSTRRSLWVTRWPPPRARRCWTCRAQTASWRLTRPSRGEAGPGGKDPAASGCAQ
jgi:hypothetical protein